MKKVKRDSSPGRHGRPIRETHEIPDDTPKSLREAKKAYVTSVLQETSSNVANAACLLGITESQLLELLVELDITLAVADPGTQHR